MAMANRRGESRHPWHVPRERGKALGHYFNSLKRSAKVANVKTVVGGSMAMLLL